MGGGGCRLHAPLPPPGGVMASRRRAVVVAASANINAPVCFLREIRPSVFGDSRGPRESGLDPLFSMISASRGQGEAADDTCFEFPAGSI